MLVVNISRHIMDIQVIQNDVVYRPLVLCHACDSGPVHCKRIIVFLILFRICRRSTVIRDLKSADLDVLYIHKQDRGGDGAFPLMVRIVQVTSVILIPLTMSVGINLRSVPLSISRHDNRCLFASAALDMKRLVFKYRSFFKKYLVSRLKRDLVDLVQRRKSLVLRETVVAVVSVDGADIIGRPQLFCFRRVSRNHRCA